MLMLSRKYGEQIMVGDDICITIGEIVNGHVVRIGIDAPKEVLILRKELYEKELQRKQDSIESED